MDLAAYQIGAHGGGQSLGDDDAVGGGLAGGGGAGDGRGGDGQVAGGAEQIRAHEDGGFSVLHEAHAVQLADLALEDLAGGVILVHVQPIGAGSQVVGDAGVDHRDVFVPLIEGSLLLLQEGVGLIDGVRGQPVVGRGHLVAALRGAGGNAVGVQGVCVDHGGAGAQNVAHQGVGSRAAGSAHLFGGALDHGIDGVHLELVGDGGVVAVLLDLHAGLGDAELLAGGDDALLQGGHGLLEGVPLAPGDGLAVLPRKGLLLAQLGEDELGTRILQQLGVVVVLHGGGHTLGGGLGSVVDAGVGVDGAGGAVGGQVDHRAGIGMDKQVFKKFHSYTPLFVRDGYPVQIVMVRSASQIDFLPSLDAAADLGPLGLGPLSGIGDALRTCSRASAQPALGGHGLSGLDRLRQCSCGLHGRCLLCRGQQLFIVSRVVCRLHGESGGDELCKGLAGLDLFHEVKSGNVLPQLLCLLTLALEQLEVLLVLFAETLGLLKLLELAVLLLQPVLHPQPFLGEVLGDAVLYGVVLGSLFEQMLLDGGKVDLAVSSRLNVVLRRSKLCQKLVALFELRLCVVELLGIIRLVFEAALDGGLDVLSVLLVVLLLDLFPRRFLRLLFCLLGLCRGPLGCELCLQRGSPLGLVRPAVLPLFPGVGNRYARPCLRCFRGRRCACALAAFPVKEEVIKKVDHIRSFLHVRCAIPCTTTLSNSNICSLQQKQKKLGPPEDGPILSS